MDQHRNPAGIAISSQSWRLPRELDPGDRFQGTIEASIAGLGIPLTRTHVVLDRRTIETAAGRFSAIGIRIEEQTTAAAEPARSIGWIAPRVGLVRLERAEPGGRDTVAELVSVRTIAE